MCAHTHVSLVRLCVYARGRAGEQAGRIHPHTHQILERQFSVWPSNMDTIASQGSKNMTVFFIFCTTSPNRFTSLSWGKGPAY